jgi:hypothetical protein
MVMLAVEIKGFSCEAFRVARVRQYRAWPESNCAEAGDIPVINQGARKVWRRLYWSGSLNDRALRPADALALSAERFSHLQVNYWLQIVAKMPSSTDADRRGRILFTFDV